MTQPDSCYRLVVAGPPSRLLVDTIDARFGSAASVSPSGSDTAVLLTADQSSLRALLTLLWDVGHELVTVSACPDEQEPTRALTRRTTRADPSQSPMIRKER